MNNSAQLYLPLAGYGHLISDNPNYNFRTI